jgi:hypothetical protein
VTYEVAIGPPVRIPTGRCKVEAHEGFVSLSWSGSRWTHSATLSTERFDNCLEAGASLILDAAQIHRSRAVAGG